MQHFIKRNSHLCCNLKLETSEDKLFSKMYGVFDTGGATNKYIKKNVGASMFPIPNFF